MSLLHLPSNLIQWVGLESYYPATITAGSAATASHIVYISHPNVDIQVASADTIRVHNAAAATRAGNVTLVW